MNFYQRFRFLIDLKKKLKHYIQYDLLLEYKQP